MSHQRYTLFPLYSSPKQERQRKQQDHENYSGKLGWWEWKDGPGKEWKRIIKKPHWNGVNVSQCSEAQGELLAMELLRQLAAAKGVKTRKVESLTTPKNQDLTGCRSRSFWRPLSWQLHQLRKWPKEFWLNIWDLWKCHWVRCLTPRHEMSEPSLKVGRGWSLCKQKQEPIGKGTFPGYSEF